VLALNRNSQIHQYDPREGKWQGLFCGHCSASETGADAGAGAGGGEAQLVECTRFKRLGSMLVTGHESGELMAWDARMIGNGPIGVYCENHTHVEEAGECETGRSNRAVACGDRTSHAVVSISFESPLKVLAGRFGGDVLCVSLT